MKFACRAAISACLILFHVAASAAAVTVSVHDSLGKPLADAVLYAEPEGGAAPGSPRPAVIEQRGMKFLPLVTVVQSGATISFPNNDRVRHHIYSFSPAKKFDQKLYAGAAASSQVFDKAGTVVLGCNIHDRMIAYVKVVDTPYFAHTDASGNARLELPAGKYTLRAWHFNLVDGAGAAQALTVKPGEGAAASFKVAVKAAADGEGSGY